MKKSKVIIPFIIAIIVIIIVATIAIINNINMLFPQHNFPLVTNYFPFLNHFC